MATNDGGQTEWAETTQRPHNEILADLLKVGLPEPYVLPLANALLAVRPPGTRIDGQSIVLDLLDSMATLAKRPGSLPSIAAIIEERLPEIAQALTDDPRVQLQALQEVERYQRIAAEREAQVAEAGALGYAPLLSEAEATENATALRLVVEAARAIQPAGAIKVSELKEGLATNTGFLLNTYDIASESADLATPWGSLSISVDHGVPEADRAAVFRELLDSLVPDTEPTIPSFGIESYALRTVNGRRLPALSRHPDASFGREQSANAAQWEKLAAPIAFPPPPEPLLSNGEAEQTAETLGGIVNLLREGRAAAHVKGPAEWDLPTVDPSGTQTRHGVCLNVRDNEVVGLVTPWGEIDFRNTLGDSPVQRLEVSRHLMGRLQLEGGVRSNRVDPAEAIESSPGVLMLGIKGGEQIGRLATFRRADHVPPRSATETASQWERIAVPVIAEVSQISAPPPPQEPTQAVTARSRWGIPPVFRRSRKGPGQS